MNTVEIFFSPTGGTEKVAHIIGKQWSDRTVKIDLSNPKTDFSGVVIGKDDKVLIAMPSFVGAGSCGGNREAEENCGKRRKLYSYLCVWKSRV